MLQSEKQKIVIEMEGRVKEQAPFVSHSIDPREEVTFTFHSLKFCPYYHNLKLNGQSKIKQIAGESHLAIRALVHTTIRLYGSSPIENVLSCSKLS